MAKKKRGGKKSMRGMKGGMKGMDKDEMFGGKSKRHRYGGKKR
jgi:hypothetical protein